MSDKINLSNAPESNEAFIISLPPCSRYPITATASHPAETRVATSDE